MFTDAIWMVLALRSVESPVINHIGATSVIILMNRDQPHSELCCKYSLFCKIYHNYITKTFTVVEPSILFEP